MGLPNTAFVVGEPLVQSRMREKRETRRRGVLTTSPKECLLQVGEWRQSYIDTTLYKDSVKSRERESDMVCGLNCGGCAIGTDESDAAFELALDMPVPAECPQVQIAGGVEIFMASSVPLKNTTKCACGKALDEDGRCSACSQEAWRQDDIAAKREQPIIDDTVVHGPEY